MFLAKIDPCSMFCLCLLIALEDIIEQILIYSYLSRVFFANKFVQKGEFEDYNVTYFHFS